MAPVDRLAVYAAILDVGAVPTFTPHDLASARRVVEACRQAGVRAIEITNRESGTYELFRELTPLVSGEQPEMILGVGTIYDAPTAALFIAAGAGFVVSPVLKPRALPSSSSAPPRCCLAFRCPACLQRPRRSRPSRCS